MLLTFQKITVVFECKCKNSLSNTSCACFFRIISLMKVYKDIDNNFGIFPILQSYQKFTSVVLKAEQPVFFLTFFVCFFFFFICCGGADKLPLSTGKLWLKN